jgi:FixJ family two-component response regulator
MNATFNNFFAMQRKATIYIVDDDPVILKSIARLVEPTGIKVKTFSRVDDFLDRYKADGPGCLVLDMWMPGMSGRKLQSLLAERDHNIPIIFVTDNANVRMAVDALKAGAVNFFEKPYPPQELFEEIQSAIRADIEAWEHREEEQKIEDKLALLKIGEREVMELIMKGNSNKEIAKILQLSVRGVEARRAKAKKTLHIHSKSELRQLLPTTEIATSHSRSTITRDLDSGSAKGDHGRIGTKKTRKAYPLNTGYLSVQHCQT